jgi:hypothetical protein
MGYELENSPRDFSIAPGDLRWLEHRLSNANRQLQAARASSVQLRGLLKPDHPILLANEIKLAQAKLRWAEAIEALCDLAVDED